MEEKGKWNWPATIYVILLTLQVPFNLLFAAGSVKIAEKGLPSPGRMVIIYTLMAVVYFLAVGVLGILNIIRSFQACARKDEFHCIRGMLILKYGMVPFFLINFCSLFLLTVVSLMGTRGMVLLAFPIALPLFILAVFCTWLAMIPGSIYSIQVIRLGREQGKITGGWAVWHGILQFLFLADVLDTMYLAVRKWNRGKGGAVMIGLLYVAVPAFLIRMIFFG